MNDKYKTLDFEPDGKASPPVDTATLPSHIGRYRVEKVLGKGGFGIVYLAHDDQLQRLVAIKVPHRKLVDRPEDAEAYLAEARTVANLDHSHIVPVHDVGSTDGFPLFIVSKYIDGTDLATRLRQSRLSLRDSVELVATVADALHFAHKQGLVHRDIKPGNLLLDKSGKSFVADFGLALREQDIGKGPGFAGTPSYMSPEQARGEGHRVDGRSDVFSLGVVFYELLVGRRPFKADSQHELLEKIKNFEPRPPRQCDDQIPKELDRICLKALSKRASERYSTAQDMAEDLRHWISNLDGDRTPAGSGWGRTTERIVPTTMGVAPSSTGKDAFLSYASPDKEAAFRLCKHLEERGINCWIAPRDVMAGADYGESIIRAIEGASTTVLMLSSHANASIHVRNEVERATSKRKRVIPVRLEEVQPSPSLELHLATAQWVDAWHSSPNEVATQLAAVLRSAGQPPPSPIGTTPASDSQIIKIVPKGLRSFDAHDADFFLELLPGPRDRDGLPDSLRFWKSRIEELDADNTFSVGLIYGPSGCGKSSLVKAGLIPRLSDKVIVVYVEATADESESRLLHGLRKRCQGLPDDLALKDTLAALRRGQGIPSGKKVVIVLDQFEQWLHAKKEEANTELVEALRQCDGARVQCIVMVRDDFWMAATRFMRELEVKLLEGQNSAAVDLFDLDHARRVLAAFGRAFGKLPENAGDKSKDQGLFLENAVAGLAQEGKVISVRLALFAEMMKGKAWTPATLKEVGGTAGVGVTFLEETFSAATAPPEHRYHQKAARGLLKTLLPESGTDIKGHMRSYGELLEASGYGSRPKDFVDLVRILDGEIRLITPTDPEGKDDAATSTVQSGEKYYQLTHDYLVPSLRDWLTRKQKETRRGRAELLLSDRAAVWNARPENRQLPSLLQWLQIQWLTAKKTWTEPQRKMMKNAGRYHVVRSAMVGMVLAAAAIIGLAIRNQVHEREQANYAVALVGRVFDANISQVPDVVKEMKKYRAWTDPLLKEEKERSAKDSRKQLHASLALLPVDAGQVEYLYERLLKAEPQELVVIRQSLLDHKQDLTERLWTLLENPQHEQDQRFHAACALSVFTPDDVRWEKFSGDVAAMLVVQKPFEIAQWSEALTGVGRWLLLPLADFLVDENRSVSERGLVTTVYGKLAANIPAAFARLENRLSEMAEPDATVESKIILAKEQASIGSALIVMGRSEKVWSLLKHSPDPTLRSFLIDRFQPMGVDPKVLMARLEKEQEVSVKRAILLSLGEYGPDRLSIDLRLHQLPSLLQLYRDDPDRGIHGAAEWLLRQLQASVAMQAIDKELATGKVEGQRRWYLNRQGQTMVVIPQPGEFWMGEETERQQSRIDRNFAIGSKEVTVDDFLRFRRDHQIDKDYSPTGDCPVGDPSWYDLAAYCNWLSEQDGIPKDQWCYEPNKAGEYAAGMTMPADFLQRTGYRLPTEAEWEYSCRAGANSGFSHGDSEELLSKYAWLVGNSLSKSHPVGSLKANDLGLFDMHGNIYEWCQDTYERKVGPEENLLVNDDASRVLRGGSFNTHSPLVRSAFRLNNQPTVRTNSVGFRVARTLPPIPFTP